MVLTAAGQQLLQASHEILPKLQSIEKQLTSKEANVRELRISTQCYTCYHWLPLLMKKFSGKYPEIEIDIVTEAMSAPIDFLLKDKIDLAIVSRKTDEKGVAFEKLFEDEAVLLVPENHPLAKKSYVTARDFANENLIIYKESADADYFMQHVLIPAGVTPARITRMQLTEARVELVKAGLGVTVLSRWLAKPFLQGGSPLRQIRIMKKGFFRTWYIATLSQKRNDVYVRQFISFLKEQDLGSKK
jgi:LysR family transcriptional regulator for metE and metH